MQLQGYLRLKTEGGKTVRIDADDFGPHEEGGWQTVNGQRRFEKLWQYTDDKYGFEVDVQAAQSVEGATIYPPDVNGAEVVEHALLVEPAEDFDPEDDGDDAY